MTIEKVSIHEALQAMAKGDEVYMITKLKRGTTVAEFASLTENADGYIRVRKEPKVPQEAEACRN